MAHRIQRMTTRLSRRAGTTGGRQLRTRQPRAGARPHPETFVPRLRRSGDPGRGQAAAWQWAVNAVRPPCGPPPTSSDILTPRGCPVHGARVVSRMVDGARTRCARNSSSADAPDSPSGRQGFRGRWCFPGRVRGSQWGLGVLLGGLRTQGGYRVHESESVSHSIVSNSLPSRGL